VPPFAGQRECTMEGLFEVLGQHGHRTTPTRKRNTLL
jgi:hypothetical protein